MRKPENGKSQPPELKIFNSIVSPISPFISQNLCADFGSNGFGGSMIVYLNLKLKYLPILFENDFTLFQQRNLFKIIKIRGMFHEIMEENLQFKYVLQSP